jgi:hypothetical protein
MKQPRRAKRMVFVALAALAIVLAVTAPSQAAGFGGHGPQGGHPGGGVEHQGGDGHHVDGHHVDGHHFEGRHFDRGFHDRFGFGVAPVFPYYAYPATPGYWYYCPSYGAYYPYVTSCPDPWVPVPAS